MSLTILNNEALEQISEKHLRLVDPIELQAIMTKVRLVKEAKNYGYQGKSRNMRFKGDIPSDVYYKMGWHRVKDRDALKNMKDRFFKAFPKFAIENKSKYA